LTGWLLGGIDVERMERIKKDLETWKKDQSFLADQW
jgi:hypothetical protein